MLSRNQPSLINNHNLIIYTANILKIFEITKFFMLKFVNENKINFSALFY